MKDDETEHDNDEDDEDDDGDDDENEEDSMSVSIPDEDHDTMVKHLFVKLKMKLFMRGYVQHPNGGRARYCMTCVSGVGGAHEGTFIGPVQCADVHRMRGCPADRSA